ncbi:MAG: hypothetical protein MZV64_27945 [Ignavibacteriales bacterium]|nr:hypothetical protein [Ignavibacteriales bacterium]
MDEIYDAARRASRSDVGSRWLLLALLRRARWWTASVNGVGADVRAAPSAVLRLLADRLSCGSYALSSFIAGRGRHPGAYRAGGSDALRALSVNCRPSIELILQLVVPRSTFLPLAGVLLLLLRRPRRASRHRALAIGVVALVDVRWSRCRCAWRFTARRAGHAVRRAACPGSPGSGRSTTSGVDGISLLLVLLTTFLTCRRDPRLAGRRRTSASRSSMLCCCSLETGMIGVFVSLDLFLFYVFWEVMLDPDVLPDRDLGRAAPHLRRDQVLPLHDGRAAS